MKNTKMKSTIEYIVAKTKLEAQSKAPCANIVDAKKSATEEELQNKLYLFAKKFNEKSKKNDYIVVSYYDVISPLGEYKDKMQWFDFSTYLKHSPEVAEKAKKKFQSLKV